MLFKNIIFFKNPVILHVIHVENTTLIICTIFVCISVYTHTREWEMNLDVEVICGVWNINIRAHGCLVLTLLDLIFQSQNPNKYELARHVLILNTMVDSRIIHLTTNTRKKFLIGGKQKCHLLVAARILQTLCFSLDHISRYHQHLMSHYNLVCVKDTKWITETSSNVISRDGVWITRICSLISLHEFSSIHF